MKHPGLLFRFLVSPETAGRLLGWRTGSRLSAFIKGDEYAALEVSATWLIKDLIPVGGLANLYGKPKVGKSFLALGIAEAIANGYSHYLGLPILHTGPVAYLQLDTPRSIWLERLQKAQSQGNDFSNIWFADIQSGTPFPFNILLEVQWLLAELAAIKPVLLVIDTLRELHPGEENDSGCMKNVISALVQATGPECASLILSHKKKEQMGHSDDLMSDNRGSGYIAGRMDAVLALSEKQLSYQSRAAGLERIAIKQDSECGMMILDSEESRLLDAMTLAYEELGPKASQRQLGERLKQLIGTWKGETMSDDAARGHVRRKIDLVKPRLNKG